MKRTFNIKVRDKSSQALNPQKQIDQYGHPFTCCPTMGCHFMCKGCFSPIIVMKQKENLRKDFFENIIYKKELPSLLEKELSKYAVLPNHLKRVQINETSEYYLPRLIKKIKEDNLPDIMYEMLDLFHKSWDSGNKWMLHILTRSPLIRIHLDKLIKMKHMVQVEVSISTLDEGIKKQIEISSPSIQQRLDTIKLLSDNGIFVRVMAMPFYGSYNDLVDLKRVTFQYGARAFKNKALNYFDWDELKNLTYEDFMADNISRKGQRSDDMYEDLNYKSGEDYIINGETATVNVKMPVEKKWAAVTKIQERIKPTDQKVIDCGYSDINSEDWGYIK